jgi:hypothetical protein
LGFSFSSDQEAVVPFDGSAFSPVADAPSATPVSNLPKWQQRLRNLLQFEAWRDDIQFFLPVTRPTPVEPTVGQLLITARGMIEHESRWVKGHYATLDGRHCAVGALRAAALRLDARRIGKAAHDVLREVARDRGFRSIEQMNDHSTHAEVVAAFDTALMAAEHRVA